MNWEIVELKNGRKTAGKVSRSGEYIEVLVPQRDGTFLRETYLTSDIRSSRQVPEDKARSFAYWYVQ